MAAPGKEEILRFGSLRGRLVSPRPLYTEEVALVFGAEILASASARNGEERFDLRIEDGADRETVGGDDPPVPAHGLRLGGTDRHPTILTEVLRAEASLDERPVRMRIVVRQPGADRYELRVHFAAVLQKLFFLMDHVVLHAAAVRLDDRVHVFVGDKGAGKSTLCLGLARAGGTVLGEDHVILRRTPSGFLVSGGDERSRVTEQTEAHFFREPLPVPPKDFAGTPKKEIRMGDVVASRPYEDFPAHCLHFPWVTGRLELRPLKAQPALLRLMKYTGHFHRFAGGADQARFLGMLADFVAGVRTFELALSRDLGDLSRLATALRNV